MIGGCALNHSLKKVRAHGKGPCTKVWDVRVRWLCTVHDRVCPRVEPSDRRTGVDPRDRMPFVGLDL